MAAVIRELKDYKSAVTIFNLLQDETDTVILDSSLIGPQGRYTIIGRKPYLKLVNDDVFLVNGEASPFSFEEYLKKYLRDNYQAKTMALPLTAGAIGYFSYDYGRIKEKVKTKHLREPDIPLCILNFYDELIIEDLAEAKVYLIANGRLRDPAKALTELEAMIEAAPPLPLSAAEKESIRVEANFGKEEYLNTITALIDYITAGDVYIANLTQKLTIKSHKKPFATFLKLRQINPSPFGAYLNYGAFKVICASPERFLELRNKKVTTRPIKGTRKRGETDREDKRLKEELRNSGKDRSELLMVVDLERNDLNRVCSPGSVEVIELFAVEEYATVFHLVATITGKLASGHNAGDLIEAAFPGGSITGAPKKRAMEIIDELENDSRGLYTGSLGYISLDGDMDLNIIIRTALYKDGIYSLGVGGGITFESETEFEYEETLQKAKAILEALK